MRKNYYIKVKDRIDRPIKPCIHCGKEVTRGHGALFCTNECLYNNYHSSPLQTKSDEPDNMQEVKKVISNIYIDSIFTPEDIED